MLINNMNTHETEPFFIASKLELACYAARTVIGITGSK